MIATFINADDAPADACARPSVLQPGRSRGPLVPILRRPAWPPNTVSRVAADTQRGALGAVALAVACAEGAARALTPRDGTIAAARVDPAEHFDAAQIARAKRYGRGQLALGAAGAATEAALLVLLVRRDRRGRTPTGSLPAVAARGARLSLCLAVVPLPFAALMRKRALDAKLATQSWPGWAADVARSSALGAGFASAGAVVVSALMRRYGERWWAPAAAGSVGVAVLVTLAGPVLLEPIFNDFTPLEDGELRREVLSLAERAGVRIGEVFEVDASRRTSAANAYVSGLGVTRRVVLFDTLTSTFTMEEARTVVAHELAHVRYRDVPRLLAFAAMVAPAGTRAVAAVAQRLDDRATPGLPALALAGAIVSSTVGIVARRLSRAVERRADSFALALTNAPEAFVSFERRITRQNLADPDPPRWLTRTLATHPPIVERIGIADAYAAGERPTPRPARPRLLPRTRAGS
jgi:STE24 endopeptidase